MPLYPDFERLYLPGIPQSDAGEPMRWLPLRGGDVLVQTTETGVELIADTPAVRERLMAHDALVLGRRAGRMYAACELPSEFDMPEKWQPIGLRALYGQVDETEWDIAGYATQVLHWRRTSGFCPVCGSATRAMANEWMRACTQCSHTRYPPVSPAVLMLVHDEDRILLSHKPGWGERYSILAGFVLPGETLEECVRREVQEESSLQVTDLVYGGSQPWPFPHQLMVGFTARYAGGDIRIDEQELDDVRWFDVRALPPLPPPLSLSRQLIDRWAGARLSSGDAF